MTMIARLMLAAALLMPFCAHAKSSVWHVSDGQSELFLGGTVHLLRKTDFPLPCEFDTAYRRAESVVLEADLREARSADFARRYAGKMMYADGKTLTARLSRKTRKSLRRLLRRSGLPAQPFIQMKPGVLMSALVAHYLNKSGVSAGGVDEHYLQQAQSDGIPLAFLETAESQMNLIINLGQGSEEDYVRHLIENLSDLRKRFRKIVSAWRSGELAALATAAQVQEIRSDYPLIFEQLLAARNDRWMKQLVEMLNTEQVEFVLVGALHLATDVGLLAQLRRRGYSVQAVVGCS